MSRGDQGPAGEVLRRAGRQSRRGQPHPPGPDGQAARGGVSPAGRDRGGQVLGTDGHKYHEGHARGVWLWVGVETGTGTGG